MTALSKFSHVSKLALLCLLLLAPAVASADKDKDQAKVRKASSEALARLYAANPGARSAIAGAKGYATFSRWGMTLGAIGGGAGKGLVVSQPGGKETFMRFVEGSAGLGWGIKNYDLIFVFQTQSALNAFVTKGWEGGSQATAAAKAGGKGGSLQGAASVSPGVWVYQITDKGLSADVGLKGTKYYVDKDMN